MAIPLPSAAGEAAIYDDAYFAGKDDFFRGRNYFEALELSILDGAFTGVPELKDATSLETVNTFWT